ncbi:PaaI family thioesterase [Zwartia vadi]|uniref:PaaI family thioesterase n=1 Tax=Zwartia vadi TaxID=3058168 RepID=UPI0025B34D93|nr:PaaI family thioesterase [Zwartia vadi]MDN3988079.1 PaaI family thioesterase [Zwartia vadi]
MSTSDTLARWIEEEKNLLASMKNGRKSGFLTPGQISSMTGLEIMQAVRRGELPSGPMAITMNYMLMEVEPGRVVLQGHPTHDVLNVQGSVHGGWFASILDGAVGNAIHSMLPAGKGYATLDLSVKMTRALSPSVGRVRAVGTVIQVGRQVATAEGKILGPDGKLHAFATTTCMILDVKPT